MKKIITVLISFLLIIPVTAQIAFASVASDIIRTGERYIGTPYSYGAAYGDTSSFDCSSFTKWVFSRHGIDLPRTSGGQAGSGKYVSKSNLQVGDLLFYDTDFDGRINHVGIYAGSGRMLNAQSSGVKYADAFSPHYWGSRYVTARRVISPSTLKPEPKPEVKSLSFPTTAERFGGTNRFEVAAKVSQDGWRNGATTVFLAKYNAYADALSAAPLAYEQDAPILLSLSDKLATATKDEINRLSPSRVVIIGGKVVLTIQ
ncbi:NlpC/P60 family protein [Pseudalkalibacillus decolorationis]|uniref:NlpC/P60 family protein n=1 Tax=Pseudalkalibacillus decolorationis TaxID=163879 RepID=UPI002147C1A7|nr:NlpC/P60 family protein [Pseudalkalibacillus decolorationis]